MSGDKLQFSYGAQLQEAVRAIVRDRATFEAAMQTANIPEEDEMELAVALGDAIGNLDLHNCADYGLSVEETRAWMEAGRPAGSVPSAPQPDHSEDPGAVMPDTSKPCGTSVK